jgi:hypothetical protein
MDGGGAFMAGGFRLGVNSLPVAPSVRSVRTQRPVQRSGAGKHFRACA